MLLLCFDSLNPFSVRKNWTLFLTVKMRLRYAQKLSFNCHLILLKYFHGTSLCKLLSSEKFMMSFK